MRFILIFVLFVAFCCSQAYAQDPQAQKTKPASAAEVSQILDELNKSVQPDEAELGELMKDADCPDCIPEDIVKMHDLYGAKINYARLEIEQAFKAGNGDFFVMFKLDSQNLGAYGYGAGFWGRGSFLYPIMFRGGSLGLDAIDIKLSDPLSQVNTANVIGSLKLKAGKLTVECAGKTKNLVAMTQAEKEAIAQKIKNEKITVRDFSEVRSPRNLFKALNKDYYFYVDSAFRGSSLPCFFMGEIGHLKEYPIEHFYYFRDGGTTIIIINGQGKLYIPQHMFETEVVKNPTWTPVGSGQKEDLEKLELREEILKGVGIDTSMFKMTDYPNPCGIFKGKSD